MQGFFDRPSPPLWKVDWKTERQKPIWKRRAKTARRFSRFMPKASAPKFHQSNGSRLNKALLALRKNSRVLRHRRAFADCFGANPVASALGNRARRDPGTAVRTYHEGFQPDPQNRNFLLGWE